MCEDAGVINIDVTRIGRIDGEASVEIRAKGLTAKEGHDYIPSNVEHVIFEPGK